MKITLTLVCLLAFSGTAGAQTTLYDTFNEGDQANVFDCCNSVPISSMHRWQVKAEIPFTVSVKARISEIDIPLFHTDGDSDTMKLLVIGDNGKKHHFLITGLGQAGECCVFETIEANGFEVVPGVQYQVLVHGMLKTSGGWNLNTIGAEGDYIAWNKRSGHQVHGILPALRIIGQ